MPAEVDRKTLPLHTTIEQMRACHTADPSLYVGRANAVPPLPPWDHRREWIRCAEVPAFLKRMFNLPVSYSTVVDWRKDGIAAPTPSDPNRRVYLVTTKAHGMRFVRKSDLLAFLNMD